MHMYTHMCTCTHDMNTHICYMNMQHMDMEIALLITTNIIPRHSPPTRPWLSATSITGRLSESLPLLLFDYYLIATGIGRVARASCA